MSVCMAWKRATLRTFAANVVWVAHAGDIRVESVESLLGVMRAHGHCLRDLLVNYDIDFDPFLCFALEDSVKAPFWVFGRRTTKVQLRGEPPVLRCVHRDQRIVLYARLREGVRERMCRRVAPRN